MITNGLDPAGEGTQLAALQKALLAGPPRRPGASPPDDRARDGLRDAERATRSRPTPRRSSAFFVYFFVYLLTGVSFLRERTGGTLERLMATPVARGEIVTGYTLGFGLFATIQVALLMLWALGDDPRPGDRAAAGVLDRARVSPSPGSPLLRLRRRAPARDGRGQPRASSCRSFARTELQIIQFIPIVIVPQFLLSGVLFPVSSLPAVIQPLAPLLPLSYAVDGLRQVFIAGADLARGVPVDLVVLAVFAVFFATIAALTIRRDVA